MFYKLQTLFLITNFSVMYVINCALVICNNVTFYVIYLGLAMSVCFLWDDLLDSSLKMAHCALYLSCVIHKAAQDTDNFMWN